MSITFSYSCWLSLTVSPSAMELLHVFQFLISVLGFSHCLFKFNVDAYSLSLSPMVACCLSLSLPAPKSFFISITVSYRCLLSITISPLPQSCCVSLNVSNSYWLSSLSRWSHGVAACLSLSPKVAGFILLSLSALCSCSMSLSVTNCAGSLSLPLPVPRDF